MYRVASLCMHFSKLEFTGMGEVASPKSLDAGENLNNILHFAESGEAMYDAFINPKYKVIQTFNMYLIYLLTFFIFSIGWYRVGKQNSERDCCDCWNRLYHQKHLWPSLQISR